MMHLSLNFSPRPQMFSTADADVSSDPLCPPPGGYGNGINGIDKLPSQNYLAYISKGQFSASRPGIGLVAATWGRPDSDPLSFIDIVIFITIIVGATFATF